jgi:hypothetical protein
MPKTTSKILPRAVLVAGHSADEALTPAERKLLAEALRRGDEARDTIEDALVSFGRWLLVTVFNDDARDALENRMNNPVWRSLRARAGGPTLRLNERMLSVAVQIAARDKRITDEAWRSLEPGRKELLLPLPDERLMRKAAQHVTRLKLTQRATRAYVGSLLAEAGEQRTTRLTAATLLGRAKRARAALAAAGLSRRAVALVGKMTPEERAALDEQVHALAAWVTAMRSALKVD